MMKHELRLSMGEQVLLQKKIKGNAEVKGKWRERISLLYGMKREGLLSTGEYHEQYCRSLVAFAEVA